MGVLQQLQVHRWPFNTAQKHFHLNWHVLIGPQNVLIGITFIELHLEGLFLKTFGFCFSFFLFLPTNIIGRPNCALNVNVIRVT